MNGRSIAIHVEVHDDLADSASWYDDKRPGLGSEFLLSIEAALAAIEEMPKSFPVVGLGARRALLKRFPYAIYFKVEANVVLVVAVVHTARSSRVWKRRSRR